MFWRILKKDLKRRKPMNTILLLFVILCSMFAAAAVNNIIAVTGGIECYFDAADVPDVNVHMFNSGENDLEEKIRELACVRERVEQLNARGFAVRMVEAVLADGNYFMVEVV